MSNNHVIELAAYNPPKAIESRQDNWVKYGEKNDYYEFLIERYNNSTTNNQVINNIIKLIYGKGLDAKDAYKKPNEFAQMKMLFSKDTLRKAITDYYLLGQFALQVIYAKNGKKIVEVQHLPIQNLRPEKCDKDGVIQNYYYSDNWHKLRDFPAVAIPTFGSGSKSLEVMVCGEYTIGQKYFSTVKYIGGLPYAKLEENTSEYLISLVESNFSPLKIVNFNNGIPDEDTQKRTVDSVKKKATGASGDKIIVAFNSDETKKTTIDSIPLDNAAQQYEYLSNESRNKIMLSHGVTSGLLFGIPSANGFSSNADEMKNAYILFQNNVIKPSQEFICDNLDKILAYNGYSLDLYFQPINILEDAATIGIESNKVVSAVNAMSPLVANKVLESMTPDEIRNLIGLPPTKGGGSLTAPTQFSAIELDSFGEEIDLNEWELVDAKAVDYDTESQLDLELKQLNEPTLLERIYKFAGVKTGVAKTKSASGQDSPKYITRYRYSGNPNPERKFCKAMMSANKLYRKEDIEAMSKQNVNPGFGMSPNPDEPYDIFLWKGGGLLSDKFPNGTCKHFWTREMYRKIGTGKNTAAQPSTPADVRKAGEIAPTNDNRGYKAPHDMK